jgi:hypothetical protein
MTWLPRGQRQLLPPLYLVIFAGPCRIVRAPAELFEIVRDGGGNELPTAGAGSSNRTEWPLLAFSKPSYTAVPVEGRAVSAPAGVGRGPSSEVIRSEGTRSWITRHQQSLADELTLMQRGWIPPPTVSFLALVYGEVHVRSPPIDILTRQCLEARNDEASREGGLCFDIAE